MQQYGNSTLFAHVTPPICVRVAVMVGSMDTDVSSGRRSGAGRSEDPP
jgi:hypothetical protein